MGVGALLTAACSGLIGVRDIYLDADASAAPDVAVPEGKADGTTTPGSDGGPDVSNPCSADLSTDPSNCGACQHDCSTGACEGGLCIMATSLRSPRGVAVRSEVYVGIVGGIGEIISCPLTGCNTAAVKPKVLTPDAGDPLPQSIAANDTHVYSCDYGGFNTGGVRRVAVGGGPTVRLPPGIPSLEKSYAVAIDANTIYWTTYDSPGSIHWCDLPNCAAGLQTAAAATTAELIAVAADGTLVWSENQGRALRTCANKVTCTPRDVVSPVTGDITGLVIDQTTIYWGTTTGEIFACPTSGCATPTRLVLEAPRAIVGTIAVGGGSLYWSAMPLDVAGGVILQTDGMIKTCPLAGCAAGTRVLATKQHDPTAMALDAKSVYWTNTGKRDFSDGVGNLVKAPR